MDRFGKKTPVRRHINPIQPLQTPAVMIMPETTRLLQEIPFDSIWDKNALVKPKPIFISPVVNDAVATAVEEVVEKEAVEKEAVAKEAVEKEAVEKEVPAKPQRKTKKTKKSPPRAVTQKVAKGKPVLENPEKEEEKEEQEEKEEKEEQKEKEAVAKAVTQKNGLNPPLLKTTKKRVRNLKVLDVNAKYVAPLTADISLNDFPTNPLYGRPSEIYVSAERRKFIQSITDKFMDYMKANKRTTHTNLRMHQQLVREYMNLYSPYRGILLYHGLGSGKTCASIAIAEGMKDARSILLLTPASLKTGFFNELKNCGDVLYKQTQNWSFVPLSQITPSEVAAVSAKFNWTPEFVEKQKGIWVSSTRKKANYQLMDRATQDSLNRQLDAMIRSKYTDINYNGGFTQKSFAAFIANGNPFDNKVIVVDEAHNLVSRITNSLNKPSSISFQLYHLLLQAVNAKIVFLSGTPIINYAHEISVLFNILRGAMNAWSFRFQGSYKSTDIVQMLMSANIHIFQYVNVSNNIITVSRNPPGFVNRYKDGELDGVQYDEDAGFMPDSEFVEAVSQALRQNGVSLISTAESHTYYALPESAKTFNELYVGTDGLNPLTKNALKKRIIGLTSYYQSQDDSNMPSIEKSEDGQDYNIVKCPMSDYQLGKYDTARAGERQEEKMPIKNNPKEADTSKMSSTYKIRSRLACNFVLPDGLDTRTDAMLENDNEMPDTMLVLEETDDYDANAMEANAMEANAMDAIEEEEAETAKKGPASSAESILDKLVSGNYLTPDGLATYSPKMARILENIKDRPDGCHLVYSVFRSLEGVGVFSRVLGVNGFRPLSFHKVGGQWDLKQDLDPAVPNYALYTGTESAEEREIVRNIQNSQWELLPDRIKSRLEQAYPGEHKNYFGAALKCLLITSAAAEGINLKNILYVHLMEPYWNMGRLAQVIGRARRMNSHIHMPLDMQRIRVYLYITEVYDKVNITEAELNKIRQNYTMLVTKDIIEENNVEQIVSTDEKIFRIALRKKNINDEILELIQNTSIDCSIYNKTGSCTTFGNVTTSEYGFTLDYKQEDNILAAKQTLKATKIKYKGKEYLRIETEPGKYYMADPAAPQIRVGTGEKVGEKVVYRWA
jgi:hypothetical protein